MHPARARKQLVAPNATSPGGSKTAQAGSPRKRDRAAADSEAGSPPAPFKLVSPRLLEDKPLRSETSTCVLDCRLADGHRGLCLTSDGPFLVGLGEQLRATAADDLLAALRLLQELCTIAKSLQLYHRASFYRKLGTHAAAPALH